MNRLATRSFLLCHLDDMTRKVVGRERRYRISRLVRLVAWRIGGNIIKVDSDLSGTDVRERKNITRHNMKFDSLNSNTFEPRKT